MSVFSSPCSYRLLLIGIFLYLELKCEVQAIDHPAYRAAVGSPEKLDSEGETGPKEKDRIHASIISTVNSNASNPFSPGRPRAKVEILVGTAPKAHPPQPDWLIRASSIMMEYDEDTRKYMHPEAGNETHRIRHSSHKHLSPNHPLGDYFSINDAPIRESSPVQSILDESSTSTAKPLPRIRIPVRALIYDGNQLSHRKMHPNKRKSEGNDTWVSLHSPTKIYIPVRFSGQDSSTSAPTNMRCVQCSANITLTAPPGKTDVEVPVPAISICSRLAQKRGRLNVAVSAGPLPGQRINEGHYPIELIVWKHRTEFHFCQYNLDVKVKRCKEISPPIGGSVDCPNGFVWGSKCSFSCSSGYVLQGHRSITCEGHSEKVSWSSSSTTCKKASISFIPAVKRLPCAKPKQPPNGTVVCDSNGKDVYPDGSVCQFFCFSGFLIKNLLTTNALIVCKNGRWTPNDNVSCFATYCSDPRIPKNGSVRCEVEDAKDKLFKSKYKNGTICHYHCDYGYAIPNSLRSFSRITCNAPHWNESSIPECKRKLVPRPRGNACKNITLFVNKRGFARVKSPQFFVKDFSSDFTLIKGKCNYSGKVGVGYYINHCAAYSREFDTTGQCTYHIVVKEKTCPPPPPVRHSSLLCNNTKSEFYPRGTICRYVCDDGFVIPLKLTKFKSKVCRSRIKWRPAAVPSCERAVPPKPARGSCVSRTFLLKENATSVKLRLPKFKSFFKESKVRVKCSLSGLLSEGNYSNFCEAVDRQLGLTSTCEYNITVQAKTCPVLPTIPSGTVLCPNSKIGHFPIGSVCAYGCDEGFVIPTSLLPHSVKMCVAHEVWNSSLVPACVSQTPPVPEADSCLNYITSPQNLIDFKYNIPKFKSSSETIPDVDCNPKNISTYATHIINCTALDPQLRIPGFCSFELDVQNPSDVEELSREEVSCPYVEEIGNGILKCNCSDSKLCTVGSLCRVICDKGYAVPLPVDKSSTSVCLCNGEWNITHSISCVKITDLPPTTITDLPMTDYTELSTISATDLSTTPVIDLPTTSATDLPITSVTDLPTTSVTDLPTTSAIDLPTTSATNLPTTLTTYLPATSATDLPTTVATDLPTTSATDSTKLIIPVTDMVKNPVTDLVTSPTVDLDTSPASGSMPNSAADAPTNTVTDINASLATNSPTTSTATDYPTTINETIYVPCKPLKLSSKNLLNCSDDLVTQKCNVTCEEGYILASTMLSTAEIECDGSDGLWDYERDYNTSQLPECLGQLPNTSVEVWLSFTVAVEHCDNTSGIELQNTIRAVLIDLNKEICHAVNCDSLQVNCSSENSEEKFLVNIIWTLLADFSPSDYESTVEPLEYEKNIEAILETTQKAITSDDQFKRDLLDKGIELFQNSYNRSHFNLTCQKEGYMADDVTLKCVECPSNTMGMNHRCVPCPEGQFQPSPGQTSCKRCPSDIKEYMGNIPSTCSGSPHSRTMRFLEIYLGDNIQ